MLLVSMMCCPSTIGDEFVMVIMEGFHTLYTVWLVGYCNAVVGWVRGCLSLCLCQISSDELEALVNNALQFIQEEAGQGSMARASLNNYR